MKILVCLKQVPDTTEVKLNEDYTLERDFIAQVMNPADESVLELGLKLCGEYGGTVTALSMGPKRTEGMLRDAYARGVDTAWLLTDSAFAGSDTLATAKTLCAAVRYLGGFDLILCGRRAVDGETGQVGPMLASLLDYGCVTNATDIRLIGERIETHQLLENGVKTWQGDVPLVITLCEWSHRLRLPTMAGLKCANEWQATRLSARDLGIQPQNCGLKGSPTRVVRVNAKPTGVRPCRMLTAEELLTLEVLP